MTNNGQDKVTAFDTLFTTNHIQILKILLTYMEPSRQKAMAVYIKFMELQYTIAFYQKNPSSSLIHMPKEEHMNVSKLCEELFPLCDHAEQEALQQMKTMQQNFENVQEMIQMVQMMKDLFPEGDNPLDGDPSGLFSGLSDSTGFDISQLFEMLHGMNPAP